MDPFTRRKAESIGALGELGLIQAIRRWLGNVNPPPPFGIGDDCAVLPGSRRRQVITVDPVIFKRHFDQSALPAEVGAKLLKRNLSDLAAMGARPTAAVLSLSLDASLKQAWLEQFYRGLAATARRYQVPVVGGDIAQADGALTASLTLLGQATGSRLLLRSGARIGDWIYVTGTLGGSILGHHLRFIPRLDEGSWLADRREVRALMDVSDGLAKDLFALVPDGARPRLSAAAVPVSPAAQRLSATTGKQPLEHALSDGEDYELVCAVSHRADLARLERDWRHRFATRFTRLGRFVDKRTPLAPDEVPIGNLRGYEHLR